MIKVVHIARLVGGVGVYIHLLAKHINEGQFENTIICNEKENTIKFQNKSNKKTQSFHVNLTREINLIKDLKCLFEIISLLKSIKPDIIHCHSAKAGFLGRIAGAYLKIPVVYTPHAYSYLSAEYKLKKFFFKNIEKAFRFIPSKTIACSTSEYNRTINDLKVNRGKVYLWNNSIEDNIIFHPTDIINQLPDKFICSIGRPSYQKNTELLIKTIIEVKNTVKNIHLVILGVGFYSPSLKNIKTLIQKNNLEENITLIPWLDRAKTMTILKKSQLLVSSSRYEGLPYSIIEALALSKPCVVTKVDGNEDLIQNEFNGFLVEAEASKMAQKIVELIKNQELVKQMGINARNEYESKYNIKNNIKALEKIYLSEA